MRKFHTELSPEADTYQISEHRRTVRKLIVIMTLGAILFNITILFNIPSLLKNIF